MYSTKFHHIRVTASLMKMKETNFLQFYGVGNEKFAYYTENV